jgi:hypothetical protein
MASDRWASILNPFLSNPANNSLILENVSLAAGANVVNHKLGRKLSGWKTTRVRASATIYDTQDSNQTPQLTLQLVSSADVVVDLEVF